MITFIGWRLRSSEPPFDVIAEGDYPQPEAHAVRVIRSVLYPPKPGTKP